jgi:hypothetical protein
MTFFSLLQTISKIGISEAVILLRLKISKSVWRKLFLWRQHKRKHLQYGTLNSNPFFVFQEKDREFFKSHYMEECRRILSEADDVLYHRFFLLSHRFQFDGKINWHLDPVEKKEWKRKRYKESKLFYRGSPKDPKLVWELNRQQYLFTLAKAYFLTRQEEYAEEFALQVRSWIEDNPVGAGINWASPLEVGIRLISWSLSLQLLAQSSPVESIKGILTASVWEQVKFLEINLSLDKVVRSNHLIGEAAGLLVASTLFRFPESEEWQERALQILKHESFTQVHSDGVTREQSISYHRFVLDFFLLAYVLILKYDLPLSQIFRTRLESMVEYILHIQMPNGRAPFIGDGDDGRGMKLSESVDFWNFRGWLAVGAALFNRGDFKFGAKDCNEEAFWLLGVSGFEKFRAIQPKALGQNLKQFDKAGQYIIRSSWKKDADYLFVRGGEFGMGGSGYSSHSHSDLLSPIICIAGQPILIDSGTFVYNGNDQERNYFRSAYAHNSVIIDGRNIMVPKKNFGWKTVCDGHLWALDMRQGSIELEFSYATIPTYRRNISYDLSLREFVITDVFRAAVEQIEWFYHISPELDVAQAEGRIIFLKQNKPIAAMIIPAPLVCGVRDGACSFHYGEKTRNKYIYVRHHVRKGDSVVFKIMRVETGPQPT